jgi:peptide/nickel transport system permease protein
MAEYGWRRLLQAVLTLLLVAGAVFVLVRLIPGDPVQVMLGDSADAASIARMRAELGLDQPLPVQFLYWLREIAAGDFGRSIATGEPVFGLVLSRFGVSAPIVLTAVFLAALLAVPAGLLAAWRQNSSLDLVLVILATISISIPSFWLGLLLLLVFGLELAWLPIVGYVPFSQDPLAAISYLLLPIATLVLIEIGVLLRMMRASALEVMRLDYVTHARAKGLPETRVLLRHVFPNAFGPTWTLIGLILGNLLGGIAVLETVFTLPGLGRLLVDAIYARDYPVVQGCLLFIALLYVMVNVLVDLLYPLFDPRVLVR